jgi:hypothetical protein
MKRNNKPASYSTEVTRRVAMSVAQAAETNRTITATYVPLVRKVARQLFGDLPALTTRQLAVLSRRGER